VRPSGRPPVDASRIRELAHRLGRVAPGRNRVYLTGGATAVLEEWRASMIDVALRLEPESDAVLRELVTLKERLQINIEFASPLDFIPELPGWRERSPLRFQEGNVDVHHFDPCSQALSKIERGFAHDVRVLCPRLRTRSPHEDSGSLRKQQYSPLPRRFRRRQRRCSERTLRARSGAGPHTNRTRWWWATAVGRGRGFESRRSPLGSRRSLVTRRRPRERVGEFFRRRTARAPVDPHARARDHRWN
jgi:hypothetical protein